jgi:hypothetical protein
MDWYKIGVTGFFIIFLVWSMYHATQQSKKRHGRK